MHNYSKSFSIFAAINVYLYINEYKERTFKGNLQDHKLGSCREPRATDDTIKRGRIHRDTSDPFP